MDNKTEFFDDDKPEDFKCDCGYPCDNYPECGGVRVTFSEPSSGAEETQERRPITIDDLHSLKNILDIEQPLNEIKVVENTVLPDNMMVVSSKIFQLFKNVNP